MSNKYLIVILRFHGDVLLTKPMIDNIKLNDPDGEIDLLVYKGTGSILEQERNVAEIIEIDNDSKENFFSRIKKEIKLWAKVRSKKYKYAFFLTTQWRVVPISWAMGKAMKAAVDDKKRRKKLWTKSFSTIFPEALENHIVQRNLLALESLGLQIFKEDLALDPTEDGWQNYSDTPDNNWVSVFGGYDGDADLHNDGDGACNPCEVEDDPATEVDESVAGVKGLFEGNASQVWIQFYTAAGTLAYSFIASFIILYVLDKIPGLGLRVAENDEDQGLDLAAHGEQASINDGAN